MKRFPARFGALALLAFCGFAAPVSAELIYGIAAVGNSTALLTWDSATPNAIINSKFVNTGGASIVGIDFRPADARLYAVTSDGHFKELDPNTGTLGGLLVNLTPPLNGFNFGFDFNPTIDRARLVAETNSNYVIDPNTRQVQLVATNLAYGAGDPNVGVDPNVVHSAYTNNFNGALTSQLYGIDTGLDILVTQANNTGVLGTVPGPGLGVNVGAVGGFDISGNTGTAYATLLPVNSSASRFYSINLATGAATDLGQIDGGVIITAMTIAPKALPEPASLSLFALAIGGGALLRRRQS